MAQLSGIISDRRKMEQQNKIFILLTKKNRKPSKFYDLMWMWRPNVFDWSTIAENYDFISLFKCCEVPDAIIIIYSIFISWFFPKFKSDYCNTCSHGLMSYFIHTRYLYSGHLYETEKTKISELRSEFDALVNIHVNFQITLQWHR